MEPVLTTPDEVTALRGQIDRLEKDMAFLVAEAQEQRRRRLEWQELQADVMPVAFDIYRLTADQLEEVEQYVRLEDVGRLLKRLARSTQRLEGLLDGLESLTDLAADLSPLTQDAFLTLMARLDDLERRGYLDFAREGLGMAGRVVAAFSAEEARQLGDNIVLILRTVQQMTQPDVMRLLQTTATTVRAAEEDEAPPSLWALLRQLNDPAVRRGLDKTLRVLHAVSEH